MRAREFITERSKEGIINPEHEAVFNNVRSYPDQNMYHGSAYDHSRFIRALAGAGAGNTPDADMGDENWAGGDPAFTPYHPVEKEITLVQGKEYLYEVETTQFINQFYWNTRPMNCYIIKFKGVEGNYTLTMATQQEQEQVRPGSILSFFIQGIKIKNFKFIKI